MKPHRLILRAAVLFVLFALGATRAYPQGALDTGTIDRTNSESYLSFGGEQAYDIVFRDASLREALQFLSRIAGVNIVMPEGVDSVVNITFKQIPLKDAVSAIIKISGLEYTLERGVLRIGRSDMFKESGEDLKTETIRLKFAPAADTALKVKPLLSSRGAVVDDDRTNSLIVKEIPSNIENVHRFVEDIDIKDAQILIESKILEAARNFSRNIGIQWGFTKGSTTGNIITGGADLSITPSTSGFGIGTLFRGLDLAAEITAAEERGDVYVISDPSIVTSNGKSANIRSGQTLLVQGSGTINIGATGGAGGGSGVQEIETGIELSVTPQITDEDYVKMRIETITSTPDYSQAINGMPVIIDNTATTEVLVKDGETTVIGGLSRYSENLTKRGVPYLSKVPLLGNLFKSKERALDNSELMVFIKPTIIRVEGQMPAQMRVKEMEVRRDSMSLAPIIDPMKDAEKKGVKKRRLSDKGGNKYVRP